jgi:hypothetical protein
MKTHALRISFLLLAAVVASGCGSAARYMVEQKPPVPLAPAPGKAMVVFVRPSKWAYAVSANIIDQNGTFLGDIPAKGHFAVSLPPGQHLLVVWAENTDALAVDLAPGKVYFVEVYATPGAWSAHMHMRAIKPGMPQWAMRDQWMVNTTQFVVSDPAGAQANLERKGRDKIMERVRRGQEHMTRYSPGQQFERTLAQADGL